MDEATSFTIRTVQIQDVSFLWDMLYEAAAVAEVMRTLGKEKALSLPVNRKYVEGWGRPGDAGVIAVDQMDQPLGAAWYRLHPDEAPGYGFVSPMIPELTIGVRADARGQGLGHALLQTLIALAQSQGYAALSLSVDRNNPALHLYERCGFRDAGISDQEETSVTMMKQWSDQDWADTRLLGVDTEQIMTRPLDGIALLTYFRRLKLSREAQELLTHMFRADCWSLAPRFAWSASFIPPKPIRELRDLVRTHTHLMQERNRHINRIHKILETANIKLGSVGSSVVGKSARQMLEALIAGESDPLQMAKLARGRMRPKIALLQQAKPRHLEPHHRFLLSQTLAQLDFLQQRVGLLEREVARRLSPFWEKSRASHDYSWHFSTFRHHSPHHEIGTDMGVFPSAAHLASWVGICPGSHLSADKRHSGKPTKGNSYLRSALIQIAWVITHMSDNYLSAQLHRLRSCLGSKKAAMAVAHSVLVIVYHVWAKGEPYQDLGPDYFRKQDKEQQARRFVRQLETLGYHVELAPQEQVTA